jgi:hypothetical protein
MNKTVNQDGEIIICVGQEGSHIRNKEVYNKTMARLLCRIRTVWSYGGVDRHCDPQDLWDIMDNVLQIGDVAEIEAENYL